MSGKSQPRLEKKKDITFDKRENILKEIRETDMWKSTFENTPDRVTTKFTSNGKNIVVETFKMKDKNQLESNVKLYDEINDIISHYKHSKLGFEVKDNTMYLNQKNQKFRSLKDISDSAEEVYTDVGELTTLVKSQATLKDPSYQTFINKYGNAKWDGNKWKVKDSTPTEIKNRMEQCLDLEKMYLLKHIEIYFITKKSYDIFKKLNDVMIYYKEARAIFVYPCKENVLVKLPEEFVKIDPLQQQTDISTTAKNLLQNSDLPFISTQSSHQQGGNINYIGGANIVNINLETFNKNETLNYFYKIYEKDFKNYDEVMRTKVTYVPKTGENQDGRPTELVGIVTESLNTDYPETKQIWKQVLETYLQNTLEEFGDESDNKTFIKHILDGQDITDFYSFFKKDENKLVKLEDDDMFKAHRQAKTKSKIDLDTLTGQAEV